MQILPQHQTEKGPRFPWAFLSSATTNPLARNIHHRQGCIMASRVICISCDDRIWQPDVLLIECGGINLIHSPDVAVTGVASDVGIRSRRRASEPKADQAARSAVRAGSANLPAAQGCAVWQALASARSAGGFRRLRGVLSLGHLSLHEQRKVTRGRAASGIKTV